MRLQLRAPDRHCQQCDQLPSHNRRQRAPIHVDLRTQHAFHERGGAWVTGEPVNAGNFSGMIITQQRELARRDHVYLHAAQATAATRASRVRSQPPEHLHRRDAFVSTVEGQNLVLGCRERRARDFDRTSPSGSSWDRLRLRQSTRREARRHHHRQHGVGRRLANLLLDPGDWTAGTPKGSPCRRARRG